MKHKLIRFDWAIKKILRNKANFDILEGFLSELLRFDITIESILESEGNKEDANDKFNRVDILVKSNDGELMLVEVQSNSELDYFHRMLYGVSKLVTEYIEEGQPYAYIKKIYSINIVYFDLGQGEDYIYEYQGKFIGLHQKDELLPSAYQQQSYKAPKVSDIFPKYYILKVNNFDDNAQNTLDEWVYFLKNSKIEDNFKAKGIGKAKNKLNYEKLSTSEKKVYERYQDSLRIERSVKHTARIEGLREGREEGLKEGEEKGEKKGRKEEKIEIAQNLLQNNVPLDIIVTSTGLTIEEIEKLKKEQ